MPSKILSTKAGSGLVKMSQNVAPKKPYELMALCDNFQRVDQ
jgi:hypothetical protein